MNYFIPSLRITSGSVEFVVLDRIGWPEGEKPNIYISAISLLAQYVIKAIANLPFAALQKQWYIIPLV